MKDRYDEHGNDKPSALARCSPDSDQALVVLVDRFAKRLLAKLRLAHANGRSGWEKDDWEQQCQDGLLRHLEKGDPRDVAAYCAFMDHHGWITRSPDVAATPEAVAWNESQSMFVARLENMAKNGNTWLTITTVLALLSDCDMLVSRQAAPPAADTMEVRRHEFIRAFVRGARHERYSMTGATQFASERDIAEAEAEKEFEAMLKAAP